MDADLNAHAGMVIRPYNPSEQQAVEQCIIELQDFERSLEPDRIAGAAVAAHYLQELLETCQKKQGQLFVAKVDGAIAGFVCVWVEMEPESILTNLSHYAYISDLVVLPAYRRRGIGKSLLAQAEAFARQQRATVLRINVLARNGDAHRLYGTAGFRDYEVHLLKALL